LVKEITENHLTFAMIQTTHDIAFGFVPDQNTAVGAPKEHSLTLIGKHGAKFMLHFWCDVVIFDCINLFDLALSVVLFDTN
jgi:hypothetical protein